jgi:hypothetical protein
MDGQAFERNWGESCYAAMTRLVHKIDLLEHDLGLRERRVVALEEQLATLTKRMQELERMVVYSPW